MVPRAHLVFCEKIKTNGMFWSFVSIATDYCACNNYWHVSTSLWFRFWQDDRWPHQIWMMQMTVKWGLLISFQGHNSEGTWWCHQMETFSALLAHCEGNPPVTSGFPSQRLVMQSFDGFCDLWLQKWLSKQSRHCWFEMPLHSLWCHCNEIHHLHYAGIILCMQSASEIRCYNVM